MAKNVSFFDPHPTLEQIQKKNVAVFAWGQASLPAGLDFYDPAGAEACRYM